MGAYLVDDVNYAANIYWWSVDTESVGRTQGDILAGGAADDTVPSGGDGIVNFLDYAVLAGHWLEELLWPECWENPRQCHGDIDGLLEGSSFSGYYYVGDTDLSMLVAAYETSEGQPGYDPCADLDNDGDVDAEDLSEFNTWYMVKEDPHGPGVPADCTPGP